MHATPIEPAPELGRPTRFRYVVLGLLAVAPASAYLTRVMSAANTTIAAEFSANDTAMGEVIAGFALGYFMFQIPGGVLASSWGVRKTLALCSVAWSVCALWGSWAASIDELWMSRVAMGLSQAALVPCCAQALSNWFPIARRGIASSVIAGSMQVGGILATQLTAILLEPLGWRGALFTYAATGAAWAIPFLALYRDHPGEQPRVNAGERELIAAGRVAAPAVVNQSGMLAAGLDVAWKMALSLSVWAYLIQAVFRAYAYEFFTTWCPAFVEKAYDLDKVDAASLASLPMWTIGVGSIVSGYVVDWIMQKSGSRWLSRSGAAAFGMFACGSCFALAVAFDDPRAVMVLIAVGALFASIGSPATWATAMDLGGKRAAVLAGTMNTLGNIGAYYCPKQVGELFQFIETYAGDWSVVLWLFAGVNCMCGVCWLFVNPRRVVLE